MASTKTNKQLMGERIRARREYLKKSQQEVADLFGVHRVTMSQYERGERGIEATELPRLAAALGVPVTYFYGEDEEKTGEEIVYEPIMDELRAAAYNGMLDGEFVSEIAEDIRRQHERRAKRQGRA